MFDLEGQLATFYKENFKMMHLYNYSLTELEEMLPFEREVYLILLEEQLKAK